jgi:TonB family protein
MSQEPSENKTKRKGLITTIAVHAALLVLFAFYGMTYLDPPPEQGGMEINFGTSDDGMMSETPEPPSESMPEPTQPETSDQVDEEVLTQDSEEAPAIIEKKEEKKVKEKEVVEEKKPDPKPNRALNMADRMKSNKTTDGGGDGITGKPGDQGKINGDPNSKNYSGLGGTGGGPSFSLSGRTMKSSPPIKDNSQEEGTVVVEIIVDKYGKVIRANAGARGSNTTSPILYEKATEAALKTKFSANPDADQQKGTMTFIFILN